MEASMSLGTYHPENEWGRFRRYPVVQTIGYWTLAAAALAIGCALFW